MASGVEWVVLLRKEMYSFKERSDIGSFLLFRHKRIPSSCVKNYRTHLIHQVYSYGELELRKRWHEEYEDKIRKGEKFASRCSTE